jgi:hypothetical protein
MVGDYATLMSDLRSMVGEGESITRLVNYEQHMINGQKVQNLKKGLVICPNSSQFCIFEECIFLKLFVL